MPFRIVRNDITMMATDAIVNTSNPNPVYAAGSDSAVYRAAGEDDLLAARKKIGRMRPGQAAITPGFLLPAKFIIHTVGPAYIDGEHGEAETLAQCYRNSLAIARRKGLKSIAFPLISTGVYGYPKPEAMKIAIATISDFLVEHEMEVYLVVFDQESFHLSGKLFADIDAYIDSHYVQNKLQSEYRRREEIGFEEFSDAFTYEKGAPESIASVSNAPIGNAPRSRVLGRPKKKASLAFILERSEETFSEMLLRLIAESGKKNADVYKKAGVSKKLFSKIKNDPSYHPSKKTVFALAIGLELNIDQTKDLLLRAGYAINPSDKFDLVIQYFIENAFYELAEIEIVLFEHGLPLINEY